MDREELAIERAREEGEETYLWVLTYSDLVTLALTFFVLLFSMSSPDADKFSKTMRELGDALGGKSVIERRGELDVLKDKIESFIKDANLTQDVELTSETRGLVLYARGGAFFTSGDVELKDDTIRLLNKTCDVLRDNVYRVLVEGHTDDLPIRSEKFPSNWELSSGRASAVVRHFIEKCGLEPSRFMAAGYAEYKPRLPPTPENRQKNRRVEIIILR